MCINARIFLCILCGIYCFFSLSVMEAAASDLVVRVEGLNKRQQSNVEATLGIMRASQQSGLGASRVQWLHEHATLDIQKALQPLGFYQPQIKAELQETSTGWQAIYVIDPGPPVIVTGMDIQVQGEGASDPVFKELWQRMPLHSGMALEHALYEDSKAQLQIVAIEYGYLSAKLVRNEVLVDTGTMQANVYLHLDTGPRAFFGEITFDQSALDEDLLQRYLAFKPGDPFSVRKVLELQASLTESKYFDKVMVEPRHDQQEDLRIPVLVNLDPHLGQHYTLGIGYGTDTGVRARAGLERALLNEHGHHYDAGLFASKIRNGISGQYKIPGKSPRTDQLVFTSSLDNEHSDVKDREALKLGVSKHRQFDTWQRIISTNYEIERFDFSGETDTTRLFMPGLSFNRVRVDNRLRTSQGYRISTNLRGAVDGILSDLSFLQILFQYKWAHSVSEDTRLIARSSIGASWVSDFNELPASVRFFAGGDQSVRGYALDSIGPENDAGDVIGGKYLITASFEYERRLAENWSFAIFADAGDAFSKQSPNIRAGAGFGIRWASPVGPVRIDLAHGLDEPGDGLRLHLSIGPDL